MTKYTNPKDFIKGAEKRQYADGQPAEPKEPAPVFEEGEGSPHLFNLRLPRSLNQKLDYIVYRLKNTKNKRTKHDICLKAVEEYTERLLKELESGIGDTVS